MNKPSILLTRRLPEPCMEVLEASSNLTVNPDDAPMNRSALLEMVPKQDGLISLGQDKVDAELIEAGSRLRVISQYAVGYNNIDLKAATERKLPVTNTPGVLTESTADVAWALIFAVARRVIEGDRLVRSGTWEGAAPTQMLGADITGATLGLVGLGRIGRAMIPRAKGFGMNILYWNRTRYTPEQERSLGVTYLPLERLLERSDFVSLHVALSSETRHLMNREALERMRRNSYLINTTRGPVVDEAALVDVLRKGGIAGAGLDVYENEPALHPGLADLDNAVLLPHVGSATLQVRTRMGFLAIENCLSACRGHRPLFVVNPGVYV